MLRHFCKKNILDVLSSGSRVSSIRQTSSNLYEPVYLDALKPKYPTYACLNFQVKGYDYPVLESYQRFLHHMANSLDLDVSHGWATPAQKLQIQKLKPHSNLVDSVYNLTVYERNIQIEDVAAKFYPIVLRLAQAALPEGVSLTVVEHDEAHDEVRYVPDNDLKELQGQLEEMGGARKKKRRK